MCTLSSTLTQVYSCETGKVILTHDLPSPAISVAVIVAAQQHQHGSAGGTTTTTTLPNNNRNNYNNDDIFISSSRRMILHAFTKDGKIHRWFLPPWVSLCADCDCGGNSGGVSNSSSNNLGWGGAYGSPSGIEGVVGDSIITTRHSQIRAAVALPISASCSPSPSRDIRQEECETFRAGRNSSSRDGGRQLIVFAGDRGLVAMDATRGVLVHEMVGPKEAMEDDNKDVGAGGGLRGGASHVAVTPDGKTIISVGHVSVLPKSYEPVLCKAFARVSTLFAFILSTK